MAGSIPTWTLSSLERCLRKGQTWLESAYLRTEAGEVGWGHFLGEPAPTVWGGTLDGIRAMLYLGVPPLSTDLNDAVAWLKGQQRPDGGFGTRELDYSACEATAWVIITLGQLGLRTDNDRAVRAAVEYLLQCVDAHGGVSTTPQDFDQPRTFPAALALWALSLQPNTGGPCNLIIAKLRATQDVETGGWGIRYGAQSNAVTTAHAVHALLVAGVSPDASWMIRAAEYIVSRQGSTGEWPNGHDEWFTKATPRIPYRTAHFGTGWGLLAITPFIGRRFQYSAELAVSRLIAKQQPSGAWLYEDFDPAEQVWCTTQALVALTLWRNNQRVTAERPKGRLRGISKSVGAVGTGLFLWLRSSFTYLAIVALALVEFRQPLTKFTHAAYRTFDIDPKGVWNNLIASAVWAVLIVLGGLSARRLGRRDGK